MKNFSTIINDKDIITVKYQKNNSVLFSESQTLTDAQKLQARSNIGAGTSNFSGNYDDLSNKPTNYVTTNTEQEITGKKTVIPPANKDNSNQIATTAWAGRRYKSIADFGFTSQTTVKAIVQKIIDNWYEYCTFACTNDDFNNFSDTPDGYGTLIIEVGSNALRPFISFTKQIGDSNSYKYWQANIVRGANNQVSEIQWYQVINDTLPQTISGAKTFTSDVVVNKATPKFNMKLSGLTNGTTPSANQFGEVCFLDKNGVYEGGIRFDSPTNGENRTKLSTNSFGTTHSNYVGLFAKKNASSATATDIWRFIPNQDAVIDLGQSDLRWRNVRAVTTYSNVYGSDLCSTNSLRLKDPNITRGTNQAASGGKQNYCRAININDKNNHKGVAVEWGYLCEKNSNGNTTKHVSELNLIVYPPNTTDNANFVKVALGKRSDGTTYFTYAGNQVVTTQNFSLSGTTLTITL